MGGGIAGGEICTAADEIRAGNVNIKSDRICCTTACTCNAYMWYACMIQHLAPASCKPAWPCHQLHAYIMLLCITSMQMQAAWGECVMVSRVIAYPSNNKDNLLLALGLGLFYNLLHLRNSFMHF